MNKTPTNATDYLDRISETYNALTEAETEAADAVEDAIYELDLDFEVPEWPEVPKNPEDATPEDWDKVVEYWEERRHFTIAAGHEVEQVLRVLAEAESIIVDAEVA